MKNIIENNNVWKGTQFWTDELEKAGVKGQLRFFNDVVVEKRPPHPESGYHLVLSNITLDGRHCDVYHTDQDENGDIVRGSTYSRLFLHIKG